MKSIYVSPEIMYEDFSLSTNIAAGCERIVGNPSEGNCAIVGSDGTSIFGGDMNICDFTPEGMGQATDTWDGFCYHVPTSDRELFNS